MIQCPADVSKTHRPCITAAPTLILPRPNSLPRLGNTLVKAGVNYRQLRAGVALVTLVVVGGEFVLSKALQTQTK